jgi:FixJ family two-component response regulator
VRASILIVEDDPRVSRTICAMLERAGYTAVHVDRAASIHAALESQRFDLLISDIHLPDDSTLAFLDDLDPNSRLPVIVITGAPTVETAVRALRHGVVDYLEKPIRYEALLASVEKALEWRNAVQAVEDAQRDAEAWLRSLRSTRHLLQVGGVRTMDDSFGASAGNDGGALLIDRLSQRERDIVAKLGIGQRVAEIATNLRISPNTVRNHLKSVFRKLGVSSQVELLAKLSGAAE